MNREQFLLAWEVWDKNPSGEHAATQMENACVKLADLLQCSVINLRSFLAEERRTGTEKEEIVDNLFLLVDAGLSL